jgi:hypothetical protein
MQMQESDESSQATASSSLNGDDHKHGFFFLDCIVDVNMLADVCLSPDRHSNVELASAKAELRSLRNQVSVFFLIFQCLSRPMLPRPGLVSPVLIGYLSFTLQMPAGNHGNPLPSLVR